MKKKLAILSGLVIFLVVGIILIELYKNTNHSTVTSGLIIKKEINPYRVAFKTFGEETNTPKELEILVEDKNVWNLIEKDRYYLIKYYWQNKEKPILGQIKINDEFGRIYGRKLNQ